METKKQRRDNDNFSRFVVLREIFVYTVRKNILDIVTLLLKIVGNVFRNIHSLPNSRCVKMDTGLSSPLRNAISNEVQNAVSNSQRELLNDITTLVDSRFSTFQANIQQSQQEISQTQLTKIEKSVCDGYKFQRKGNENQFKHIVKVMSKISEARNLLDVPDTCMNLQKVSSAKEKITEGMQLIQERQKQIKLADQSELGWRVVQEYVSNPIADDSEDERRMNRAQLRAERKAKAEKAKKKSRYVPYNKDRVTEEKTGNFKPGRCFTCCKNGHWSDSSPANKSKIISALKTFCIFG